MSPPRLCRARILCPLCPLLTSARRSVRISPNPVRFYSDIVQTSRGKIHSLPCVNAGFIKHTPLRMENFVATCPLVPGVPHLLSGSCSSPRTFGLDFLQTPPHDDAPALFLTFGSAYTWCEDFHLASYVPCLAHTAELSDHGTSLLALASE